ncbi:interaptin-like [Adelges cooleyi]|uniref:interaptin-like n=1 Tax=Adelges cooleyi TaxID=133065 RepID=UPI00217F9A86|nr:interaptin-like [Adelges cooleyi]
MFVLKIIAISLTLYTNVRAELCDPNQVVEFTCKDSLCETISPESKLLNRHTKKNITDVVGFNENSFLVKIKNNFNIIPRNDLRITTFSERGFNHKVKINKNTRNICQYKEKNNNDGTQSDIVNNLTSQTIGTNVEDELKNPIKKLDSINTPSEHTDNVHDINMFEENKDDVPSTLLNISESENINVDHSLDDTSITTDELNVSTMKNIAAVVEKNVPSESVGLSEEKKFDNQPTFSPLEAQKEIPENSDSIDNNDNENEQDLNSLLSDGTDGPETTDPLELPDKSTLETSVNKECSLGDCSNKMEKTLPIEGKDGNQQFQSNPSMNVAAQASDVLITANPKETNTISLNETDLKDKQNESIAPTATPDMPNANLEKSSTKIPNEIDLINEQNGEIFPQAIGATSPNEIYSIDKSSSSNTLPQINGITIREGTNIVNEEKPNTTSFNETDLKDELTENTAPQLNENQLQEKTNTSNEETVATKVQKVPINASNEKLDDVLTKNVLFHNQSTKTKEQEQINIQNNQITSLDLNSTDTYNTSDENNTTFDSSVEVPSIETNKKDYVSPYQKSLDNPVIIETENIGNVQNKDRETPVDVQAECNSVTDCPHSTVSQNGLSSSYQYQHKAIKNAVDPELIVKKIDRGSFVSSFGHPDSCSGISCMSNEVLKQDVKTVAQTVPTSGQDDSVHANDAAYTIEKVEKEDKSMNEIIETHTDEWNFMDYIQQWLSSPTTNTVEFISNIFSNSNSFNDNQIEIFSCDDFGNEENLNHRKQMNDHLKTYFIVAAVVTLLFTVGYCKYQKGAYENHLLTLLAVKEQSLLIAENELCILKEQNTEGTTIAVEKNAEFDELRDQLARSEDIISSQSIKIENLEQEVEELTESGMEMHSLLSSALESSTKNNENLHAVKAKLVESENLITALTQKNFEKTMELEKKCEVIKNYQMSTDELAQKNSQLFEENEKLSSELEQIIAKNMLKESKMIKQIKTLEFELDKKNSALITAESEVTLSKNSLEDMLSQKFNLADAKKMMNSIKASAELKSAKHMCEQYKCKLEEYAQSNQQFTDHIDTLKTEITNIKASYSKLNKTNDELENKLNVLTKFFKDQEKEYQKQINEKSLLYNNKEGESANLNEQLEFLNQEISNYKSEIQSLKKEITDQEASYKIQLSAAEKKASDYWISFRQSERKLKEMELESAQLRNKLTMSDKKHENGTTSIDSSKDFEDELLDIPLPTVSPEFTLLDFEPPPPLIPSSLRHASTDQRLPPLGALGQASTSPIPLSRRINRSMSPDSPPPPPSIQRSSAFRPLPHRYNYMDRQNSLGHSVESLDK